MLSSKEDNVFLSAIEQHKGIIYKVANSYCKNTEDRKDLIQEIIYQLKRWFKIIFGTSEWTSVIKR